MIDLVKRLAVRPELVSDNPLDLSALGDELLRQLPEDYKDFLRHVRQFDTPEVIMIKCDIPEIVVSDGLADLAHLFSICDDSSNDLRELIDGYNGRLPKGFIPIGDDFSGNLYCLRLEKGYDGEVWFWPHDAEGPEDDPSLMIKVANSFTEFMRMLRIDNRYGFLSEEIAKRGHELALAVPHTKR